MAVVALVLWAHAAEAKPQPCSIKITTTYFGRTAEVWQVKQGKIHVETFLRDKKVKVDRKLTAEERRRLDAFMKAFPLRKLKTRYVAKVRGESSTTYEIRHGEYRKKIYQYFKDQKDLTALWKLLRSFAAARPPAPGGTAR